MAFALSMEAVATPRLPCQSPGSRPGALAPAVINPPAILALASWYGPRHHGRPTASGEIYEVSALTAAHRTLPFGTRLRVTNPSNGRTVDVCVNDRGPFEPGRSLDLSEAAARLIGTHYAGTATVEIVVLQ